MGRSNVRVDGKRRSGLGLTLILVGVIGVVAGPFLFINGGLNLVQVMVDAAFARAPLFGQSYSRVPGSAYVWPVVMLGVGLCALPLGWIALFRGLAIAWPRRFDRSL